MISQYFGQNLGCLIGNDAIVTKRFVIQAGFFQTLPGGSVRTNAIDHVLIAGPPLETCHGKRLVAVAVWMTRFELGEGHCAQTGGAVQSAFGFCAGLAIAQTGALLGVATEKCALTTCLVIAGEPLGLQVDVGAEEHGIAVAVGMDHHHSLAITVSLHMVEHLMVQNDGLVFGSEALQARYVAPGDLAIVGLVAAWTGACGSLGEITQRGIGAQRAHLL